MLNYIILGIIQGLTEFLPISSSGHLYLFKNFWGVSEDFLSFVVFLHLATLLAIVVYFFKKLKEGLFNFRLLSYISITTIISGIIAIFLKKYIEILSNYRYFIALCFFINSLVLLSVKSKSNNKELKYFGLKDTLMLGLLQGLAVLPGISRAGITIVGLLKRGFVEREAFNLSFIMAIPIIIGAFIGESKYILFDKTISVNMLVSFIVAFFSGILALMLLKRTVIKLKFKLFGYYCLILSILSILVRG
ncbi:MAG: undecaprenyl-diphosphate phosphatase [Candidatus Omnitrophica bacterium]|nr:undecaprenyl-diphosphate phosphatase [Candidatus Omnitrophota bacterium]